MAKRRRRKNKESKYSISISLVGVIMMIIAVLGSGLFGNNLGVVGNFIRALSVFLFGTYAIVFQIIIFVIGFYMLLMGHKPKMSSKIIGVIIIIVGLLALSHFDFLREYNFDFKETFNTTKEMAKEAFVAITNSEDYIFYPNSGGFVGCLFTGLFYYLFSETGTKIVSIVLIVGGVSLFVGISIAQLIKKGFEKGKEMIPTIRERDDDEDDEEEKKPPRKVKINDNTSNATSGDDKKVIASIDELTHAREANAFEVSVPTEQINENLNYKLPPLSLLNNPKKSKNSNNQAVIESNIDALERVLKDFGIIAKVVEVNSGPSVTQYELEVQSGTKLNKLTGINKEISLALAKKDVRIQAPIPGKSTVGIEIANDEISAVTLKEILETMPSNKANNKLSVALGKNIMGKSIFCDINKMPHLLVAGATGSGKSVCINCMIASILMRTKPDEVKLMMVDPKKVELSIYNGIPHLMSPVVTDPRKASQALQKVVSEMENRYNIFEEKKVKNIESYNEWVEKENKKRDADNQIKKMHYIVVIVDELSDLMVVASKEVEDSILRLAQMARAAGIHMIIATQRPSTDVITGIVKANIPSRIAFAVSSNIDSRTILDMGGAEKLLGRGDMLFFPMGEISPQRVQGAYVSDEEIQKLVDYTVSQQKAMYDENFMKVINGAADQGNAGGPVKTVEESYDDPLYNDIVEFAVQSGKISASLIQRKFKLGYNRAARIVDLLEERGIVGPQNGSKPREVLVKLGKTEDEE